MWEHHKSPTAKQALDRIAAIDAIEARTTFNSLNPETYLREILDRIANRHPISRIDELMLWS